MVARLCAELCALEPRRLFSYKVEGRISLTNDLLKSLHEARRAQYQRE